MPICIQENAYENIVCEMSAILLRTPYVKKRDPRIPEGRLCYMYQHDIY